jgi:hypothetical protein
MLPKHRLKRLAGLLPLLTTALLVYWLHWCLPIVAAAAAIPTVSVGLQASVDAADPFPAADNATPFMLVAQLALDQAPQPPSVIVAVPLNPSGSLLIPASAISLPTSFNCSLTNNNTMLVCLIAPSGATWGTSGFVVFNVFLTATDGHTVMSSPTILRVQ